MTDENVIDDSSGNSTLQGTDAEDTFVFEAGNGDDTITGFTDGQDLIDLSAFPTISGFTDLLFESDDTGVKIDLTAHGGGTIFLQGFSIANLSSKDFVFREDQTLTGDANDNTLTGDTGDDTIKGRGGDDTLDGGAGVDWIEGGAGDDTLTGGSQADMFVFAPGHGNDTITDFAQGEDRINLTKFSGISSFDDLTITSDDNGVTIDLTAYDGGTIKLDGLSSDDIDAGDFLFADGFEYGTDTSETIRGGDDADSIDALRGNDRIFGYGGDDNLRGGEGIDYLFGGEGDDTLYGGEGDDFLYGGADDDTIYGGAGRDGISGEAGDDTIYGGADNDYIQGGAGEDTISGGAGDDTMSGGDDADTFVVATGEGNDTITDFTDGEDTIDLTAFTNITGFSDLTISASGSTAVIDLSSKGGGEIRLQNVDVEDLDASDFNFYDSSAEGEADGM